MATVKGAFYNYFGEMLDVRFGRGASIAMHQKVGINTHFVESADYPEELLFSLVIAANEMTGVGTKELIQSFDQLLLCSMGRQTPAAHEKEVQRRRVAELQLAEKSKGLERCNAELSDSHIELKESYNNLNIERTERELLLNTHESLTEDLQLASKLQSELLPLPVKLETHSASGCLHPARYMAGDGFDYFMLPNNIFAFYIVDVEGHGAASAMTSFAIHSQLNPKLNGICRSNLDKHSDHAEAVCATVKDLNHTFYRHDITSKYFTMVYGLLDLTTGIATWCQAGHPAPVVSTSSSVVEVGDGGFPVGIIENPVFSASSCSMNANDRLALYSDGAIECFSDGEAFGKARLLKLLDNCRLEDQETCIAAFKHELMKWNGGEEFIDDVTVLFIDYHGPSAALSR